MSEERRTKILEGMFQAIATEDRKPELESPFVSPADMAMEEIVLTETEAVFLEKMTEEGRGKQAVFAGIAPTFVSVDEEILRAAVSAVESGIEYAREVLTTHEATFG